MKELSASSQNIVSGLFPKRGGYRKPIRLSNVIMDVLITHDSHAYEIYREYKKRIKATETGAKKKYNKGSYQNTWHYLRLLERLGLVQRTKKGVSGKWEPVMWHMTSTGLEEGWKHPRETYNDTI